MIKHAISEDNMIINKIKLNEDFEMGGHSQKMAGQGLKLAGQGQKLADQSQKMTGQSQKVADCSE